MTWAMRRSRSAMGRARPIPARATRRAIARTPICSVHPAPTRAPCRTCASPSRTPTPASKRAAGHGRSPSASFRWRRPWPASTCGSRPAGSASCTGTSRPSGPSCSRAGRGSPPSTRKAAPSRTTSARGTCGTSRPASRTRSRALEGDGCEFLLVFDDGDFSEDSTFLGHRLARPYPARGPGQELRRARGRLRRHPRQGALHLPGEGARPARRGPGRRRRAVAQRLQLPAAAPRSRSARAGGTVRISDSTTFPAATTIAAAFVEVEPGGDARAALAPERERGAVLHLRPGADDGLRRRRARRAPSTTGRATSASCRGPWATTSRTPATRPCASSRCSAADRFADVSLSQLDGEDAARARPRASARRRSRHRGTARRRATDRALSVRGAASAPPRDVTMVSRRPAGRSASHRAGSSRAASSCSP